MGNESADVDFVDFDALFEWGESRWQAELARMPPVQRAIAAALADSCEEWFRPLKGGGYVPDVRTISRIAAGAVEQFSGPSGAGHA